MTEPEEFTGLKGNTIPRKISVDTISFSAHVDYAQNSEFIQSVKAQHVVSFSSPSIESSDFIIPSHSSRSWSTENRPTWAGCVQP